MRSKFIIQAGAFLLTGIFLYDLIDKFIYTFFIRDIPPTTLYTLEGDPPDIPLSTPDYWAPVVMLLGTFAISFEIGAIGCLIAALFTRAPSTVYRDAFLMSTLIFACYISLLSWLKGSISSKRPYACIYLLGKLPGWQQLLLLHLALLNVAITGYFYNLRIPKSKTVLVLADFKG
ncbi:protein kinase family protein [Mucilaginibacter polytrichastri]|uniref:hypothetical protein n=1 Tax=Mucilaginibacter polytrichastri TaxID=1302689 RepID=UPI0008E84C9E|nr:hypothetical protein [Mucilaginibacter polytrichastri]SFS61915.1 hypothetical protein SAMN04487890_102420 [Mucilaginibacter polytrichastri]